jgi:hypothetical protein
VRGDQQLRRLLTAVLLCCPPYNWRWVSAQLVRSAHEQDQYTEWYFIAKGYPFGLEQISEVWPVVLEVITTHVDEGATQFHYRLDDGVRRGPGGEDLDQGADGDQDVKADPDFLASLDKSAAREEGLL